MKKYYFFMLATLSLLVACITGQTVKTVTGTGNVITKETVLSKFEGIEIVGSCEVEVLKGSDYKVSFSDYENLVPYFKIEVKDNKLVIKQPNNTEFKNSKAKAIVYLPSNLNGLSVIGAGNIVLKSEFNTLADVTITGEGNISSEVASTGNSLASTITGTGNIDLRNIEYKTASCSISGEGNIYVNVSNSLNASISGSGNINYKGDPTVTKEIAGEGSVAKL